MSFCSENRTSEKSPVDLAALSTHGVHCLGKLNHRFKIFRLTTVFVFDTEKKNQVELVV